MIGQLVVGILATNCYIYSDDVTKETVVIDPGAEGEEILRAVKDKDLLVKGILLTHGHYDHILAADAVQKATGAPVYIHEEDRHFLRKEKVDALHPSAGYTEPKDIRTVTDGFVFTIGSIPIRFLNTKGHSKGSCVLLSGEYMFAGDTLFYLNCGRCDLEGGDYGEMLSSLKMLAQLDGNYAVLPGHGQFSELDVERRYNPYMKEALER